MKKNIIGSVLIDAMATAVRWNFNQRKKEVELLDLSRANEKHLL